MCCFYLILYVHVRLTASCSKIRLFISHHVVSCTLFGQCRFFLIRTVLLILSHVNHRLRLPLFCLDLISHLGQFCRFLQFETFSHPRSSRLQNFPLYHVCFSFSFAPARDYFINEQTNKATPSKNHTLYPSWLIFLTEACYCPASGIWNIDVHFLHFTHLSCSMPSFPAWDKTSVTHSFFAVFFGDVVWSLKISSKGRMKWLSRFSAFHFTCFHH